jgi:hypothetical protein
VTDDAKRVGRRDQREAEAVDHAHAVATFYKALRARGVPAAAAQAITEAYVAATFGDEPWREAWKE